jgi:hypothetical protein
MKLVVSIVWLLFSSVALAQTQVEYSCLETPEHRQFDFWAGEWVTRSEDGSKLYGNNTITITDRGCVLKENWRSTMGSTGSSINFYDLKDQRWTPMMDGRVRQFFEEQDATGKWQVWFDGYYSRVD